MTLVYREIIFGEGLLGLPFGICREDVINRIGDPDRVERDIDEDTGEADHLWWHHESLDLQLGFSAEGYYRLTSCAVMSAEYLFEGQPLVGKHRDAATDILAKAGFEIDIANELDEHEDAVLAGVSVVDFTDPGPSLWLRDDIVIVVLWLVSYDDAGEVVWPPANQLGN